MLQLPAFDLPADGLPAALRTNGYAALAPIGLAATCEVSIAALQALRPSWENLPPDKYLRDGGRYRFRRHGCYVIEPDAARIERVPHRAHWQPVEYNALHGGIERWFEPVEPAVEDAPAWRRVLIALGSVFTRVSGTARWYVEAHQFRIDTTSGIGRPTPEGAHRDGVDYVAIVLIGRRSIRGGETRVFEADGPSGVRFTMVEPWTTLLLDDARIVHETTPIQPEGEHGHRDTLVVTYRSGGFQGPEQDSGP